jgi:hypothetical protein
VLHWHDTPELRVELYAYNKQDVVTERELHQKLQALSPEEQAVWVIDQEVNDLGVHIDDALATAAAIMAAQALRRPACANVPRDRRCGREGLTSETAKAWLQAQRVKPPRRPKSRSTGRNGRTVSKRMTSEDY